MAMALLCSPSPFTTHHINPFFRNQSRILLSQKKCKLKEKIMACSCACSSSEPSLQNRFCRRDLMLFGLSSSLSMALPSSGILAGEDLKMDSVVDEINAYTYSYPVELPSKKFLFKWVESRKPERYSSAAPLSPDARLRIVSERVDIIDNLILSVSIGPPNLHLHCESLQLNVCLRVQFLMPVLIKLMVSHTGFYEYIVRKSPTKTAQESNLFRHYIASTTERDGYLYSLSASTLSKQWDKMGPYLEKTVASFRLLPPTKDYVPPYKDPWRFW
ncbi:hypothetical protein OIU76_008837 [Salix suchowensis]|nr:hypothetical protein OIU76_008837 [Salix suchowensis]